MSGPAGLSGTALFLDFDGTLADIVDDPDAARLPPGFGGVLTSLAEACGGALAIVSGRSVASLDARLPAGLWRVGGHGAEIAAPGEAPPPPKGAPQAVAEAARFLHQSFPGVRIETKATGVAVHFRQAPNAARACRAALEAAIAAAPGYAVQEGKMVIEARPREADKGRALEMLMAGAPFAGRRPLALGDDLTDGAMTAAAARLGGRAFSIGADLPGAERRFERPVEARAWLIGLLEPTAPYFGQASCVCWATGPSVGP